MLTFGRRFKGNTVVDIAPRQDTGGYPIFLRDRYKNDKAPLKKKMHYVSDKQIAIW